MSRQGKRRSGQRVEGRLLRFQDLKERGYPFTRKHTAFLERAGLFPEHVQIGPNTIAWLEHEYYQWLEKRIRARRKRIGDNGGPPLEDDDLAAVRKAGLATAEPPAAGQ